MALSEGERNHSSANRCDTARGRYPLTQPDDIETAGFSESDDAERYARGPEEEEEE
jgi:hypothetical protein